LPFGNSSKVSFKKGGDTDAWIIDCRIDHRDYLAGGFYREADFRSLVHPGRSFVRDSDDSNLAKIGG
jgi:hypothetical protein